MTRRGQLFSDSGKLHKIRRFCAFRIGNERAFVSHNDESAHILPSDRAAVSGANPCTECNRRIYNILQVLHSTAA